MITLSRNIIALFIVLASSVAANGQQIANIDSLKAVLHKQKEDTNKVKLLYSLSFYYDAGSYADTALVYAQQAVDLAEKLNDEPGLFWSEITRGEAFAVLGNYPLALECDFRALALAKKLNDTIKLCYGNGSLSGCYYYMGDYTTSLKYTHEVIKLVNSNDMYWMWIQMTKAYHMMGQTDSALLYAKKAYEMIEKKESLYAKSVISTLMGNAYSGKANYDSALFYYRLGVSLSLQRNTQTHLIDNYNGIASVYNARGNIDSALWYCKRIMAEKITKTYPMGLLTAANLLAEVYDKKDPDSSLKYLKTAIAIKDNLSNRQKTIAVQNLIYKEQEKQQEIQAVKLKFRNQLILYAVIGILLVIMILTGIFLRNQRQKQLQHIRNSIADDLHDDIGSTLSSISIMSELAKKKSPEASILLSSIGESTASLQENMSDIVWAVKSENDNFENVLQRMNHFACEILDAKNIMMDFKANASVSTLRLTMKQRKNLYLFFKEAINNAAKHSDAKNVFAHISHKKSRVEVIIRDDGKGFNTDQTFDGNGLSTLKKRSEEVNGSFKIQSQPDKGTIVSFSFKTT